MNETEDAVVLGTTPETAREYEGWIDDRPVETVHDTDEVLSVVNPDVAAVVLDRDIAGDGVGTVLDRIREAGVDRPIVVLADDGPDADTAGWGFNECLTRPFGAASFRETIDRLADLSDEAVQKQELLSLAASQAALELELSRDELAESDVYEELTTRLGTLRERADEPLDELERQLSRSPS